MNRYCTNSFLELFSLVCLTLFLFLLVGTSGWGQPSESLPLDSTLHSARLDVNYLTSPELAGRGYTQAGHIQAADYISKRFQELGLREVAGKHFQPFTVTVDTFTRPPTLTIDSVRIEFGKDFILNPGNAGGEKKKLAILRVGSGLRIDGKIDDYKGVSAKGKLVVIESTIPDSISADTTIPRDFLDRDFRIAYALRAGAEGVALLVDRPTYGNFFEQWPKPLFEINRSSLSSTVERASYSVQRQGNVQVTTQNVLGILPGTGETDSIIIICGHYDHLGSVGDSIFFPGANDNASGIAMMLALAKAFAENPIKYQILFVALSGEEIGLRGSKFFAENSPVDLKRVRFLINLDMVASGIDGVMAVGGVEYPEEFSLLREVADSLGINDLRKRANAPNSDHWFILKEGVRGFYIYPFVGHQPYHHINDLPETLQWETFRKMYNLIGTFVRMLK
ncbi:MAG: M28 family peptidase [Ignavibacteriae bacterium]|nr:M28 family peptidase [Ignavibacteriota bacterium]MCB9215795.1 M28 family peptidase [Ignavibacteria bacterium]